MTNPPDERGALIVTCTSCGAEMRGDGRWLHEADCPQTRLWQTKKEQTR